MATGGIAEGMTTGLQRFEQFANRIKRVPIAVWRRLCVAVFSLWLTFSLAQLFWLILPAPDLPQPPLTLPANAAFASQPSSAGASVDIAAIQEMAPFGEGGEMVEETAAPQVQGIEQDAVDSSLSIKLVGTVASNEERLAKAFIADGGKQESFSPGEELTLGPSGVKLAKVMIDRVILDNNGRYETLWLYQGKDDFGNASGRGSVSQSSYRSAPVQRYEPQEQSDAPEDVASVMPEEGQTEPTEDQIQTVNELINVSMHREGGQFLGFKINPKRDAELFTQLGLEPNDIVTAVNNITLDDTSRAMEVYRSLSTSSQATLEIMRDGVPTTVTIDLDQY